MGTSGVVRAVGRISTAVAVAVLLVLAAPAPRALAAPGESISTYDVRVEVRQDGQLAVTETIGYDFAGGQRHGIVRRIPVRRRHDETRDRILPIDQVVVTADGATVPVRRDRDGGYEVLTVGDPRRTVTGRHSYQIAYRVRGAVRSLPDHDELYWNAVGEEWSVPVEAAAVTVTGPAAARRAECYAGPGGSRRHCAESTIAAGTATFRHTGLTDGSALTVVVAFPAGSVAPQRPVLAAHRSLATAFRVAPGPVAAAVGLAVLEMLAVLVIVRLPRRNRRRTGRRTPGGGGGSVAGLIRPSEIRPAQAGALHAGRVGRREIPATIVDLAVRRHLRIRELLPARGMRTPDWELTALTLPAGYTRGDGRLLPYEQTLFRGLFDGRDRVRVSELGGPFARARSRARQQIDADLVHQGWYRRSPARTRTRLRSFALWGVVVSAGVTAVLAVYTHVALVGLGPAVASLLVFVLAGWLPARTAEGRAMLARVRRLRRHLATTGVGPPGSAERDTSFSEYLPYAIVFGLSRRWTRAFARADRRTGYPATSSGDGSGADWYWYDGGGGGANGDGSGRSPGLGGALARFTTATASGGAGTWASGGGSSGFSGGGVSGGGFSGGGDGGGGGGSW